MPTSRTASCCWMVPSLGPAASMPLVQPAIFCFRRTPYRCSRLSAFRLSGTFPTRLNSAPATDAVWIHYDGNTNSILERNIGQALGMGAVFDPKTYESTLRIANLHRLEVLTHKLNAPKWPADILGPIDPDESDSRRENLQRHMPRLPPEPPLRADRCRDRSSTGQQLRPTRRRRRAVSRPQSSRSLTA